MTDLEDTTHLLNTGIFSGAYDDEDVGAEADLEQPMETTMNVSPIPTTRIYKDHPKEQIIGDPVLAPQTRRMTKCAQEHAMIEAMQDELLQFRLHKLWRLVNLPKGKHAIRTKWVYRNKKDERGIVVRNKARLVYVNDIIFGSTKKSLCVEFEQMMHKRFQMSSMGELTFFLRLQVKQEYDGIFISQDKYVADILKKFDFVIAKTANTPIETNKALDKDEEAEDFDVCAYARFQVTPKVSHLHAVKRIFRYLKGQPKFGLWYLRDSPFNLEAFSDSDYAGASLDRKSTNRGCQFLGKKIVSHNMVAYLKKPTESEGFQEIVDFLNGSHIRYAFTKNPTIYVSLIEKFWQTTIVKTVDNGEQEITAIVDGKEFTITEASVRRHLQLADVK
ncbi:uncharacterized mitochondrial protein-like protein, partial [Tanacetum coccineum]